MSDNLMDKLKQFEDTPQDSESSTVKKEIATVVEAKPVVEEIHVPVVKKIVPPKEKTLSFNLSYTILKFIKNNNLVTIKQSGRVMKMLKERFNGQYDPVEANKIIRNYFTERK